MSTADVRLHDETEIERIEHWRAEALERAGFDLRSASALAMRHDVDLHDAIDLVDRGCSPELALQGQVPIALDFGFPIVKGANDREQMFSFYVGLFR